MHMFKILKSKLKKEVNIDVPLSYIGIIDEVSCESVRGWVALSDNTAITKPVIIKVNERPYEIPCLSYREDLKLHGIADGNAAFELAFQDDESEGLTIEVFVENKKVLSNKLLKGEVALKNKDPYFVDFYKKSRIKNEISRLDDGLNIQLLQSSEYENKFCSTFFYRVSNSKLNLEHSLQIGQRLISDIFSNDVIELTLNTNKAFQARVELFDQNQNILVDRRIDIQPGWRTYATPLCNFDFDLLAKAKSIVLVLNIDSSSYVDLGGLIVREAGSQYLIRKPKFEKVKVKVDKTVIINEKFSNCWLANEYARLKRKQLISPGVIYEAKDDLESELSARLSDKGIDIKVGKLKGYARIAYSIDIHSLKSMPIQGAVSGVGECQNLIKNIYIYSKGKEDKILNKFRVNSKLIDGMNQWQFVLDYSSVCNLLGTTAENHEYRLAIEFNEYNEVEGFSVSLSQEQKMIKEEVFTAIEDSAISSQLDVIAGYYDILKNDVSSTKTNSLSVKKSNDATVDIVIPVYNAKEFVVECIESIIKYTTVKYRIVIVDDCSTDGISEILDEYADKYNFIVVHHHVQNVGYTANVNKGFEIAETEWVLLLNSDTVVTPYWLENMLEATCEEGVAIIGPLGNAASWQSVPNVLSSQGGWDFNLLPNNLSPNDIAFQLNLNRQQSYAEAGVLNGFCQLINRGLFFEVGKLDEITFPKGYGEENDLCARLIEKGYKLLVSANSYVYHHKSKSFGHDIRAELSEKGCAALKKKHPDYNWSLVSKQLYNHDVLVKARRIVAPLYDA